jgi:predicted DNA-binding ribbon-helix-helix protein
LTATADRNANGTRKYSVTIQGHRTSLSLEPVFWRALQDAARRERKPVARLVAEIDEARTTALSSAIRVWLFNRALNSSV